MTYNPGIIHNFTDGSTMTNPYWRPDWIFGQPTLKAWWD